MKTTLIIHFIVLALLLHPSCERQQEKLPAIEETTSENLDQNKTQELVPRVNNTESSKAPEEIQPPRIIVSPPTLNRIFQEAEEAFSNKDFSVAVAKCEELLKLLGPGAGHPYEMLYFNIGLGKLLQGKYPEAAIAFRDCIQRFPKDEYTSRAYLGLGRACNMQDVPPNKIEALEAFKKAAEDPKQKSEADLWISRISQSHTNPQKAEQVMPPNGP
jgi:TolA-binding protein